jgi:tetratricopeptide (TPR) repeat protein
MPAPNRSVDEHGFPTPVKFDAPTPEPQSPRDKRSQGSRLTRWKWAFLLLLPAILFGPQLYDLGCDYVAGLQLRKAVRDFENGDFQRARLNFDRAIEWEPAAYRRWEPYWLRAEVREKVQDLDGALSDCDEALKLLAEDKRDKHDYRALVSVYRTRAWVLERCGKHRDALAACKIGIDLCPPGDGAELPTMLNTRAYICALSGLDLENGLRDINEALQGRPGEPELIDTRGYLLLKLGKADEALADMQKAIPPIEEERLERAKRLNEAELMHNPQARRYWARLVEEVEHDLAVMYHHRGEIYDKLGKKDAARVDADRAKQFGYDPDKGVL